MVQKKLAIWVWAIYLGRDGGYISTPLKKKEDRVQINLPSLFPFRGFQLALLFPVGKARRHSSGLLFPIGEN